MPDERPIYHSNREKARVLLADAEQKKAAASELLPWWQRPAVINAAKTIAVAILLALLSLLGYEQTSVDPRLDAAKQDVRLIQAGESGPVEIVTENGTRIIIQ